MRVVAGPNRCASFAQTQIQVNVDFRSLQIRGNGRFVVTLDRDAFIGALQAAKADRERVAFGRLAGLAERRDDPNTVCIFARYCPLTSGELAIERAILCALASLAPPTCTAMNFEAP